MVTGHNGQLNVLMQILNALHGLQGKSNHLCTKGYTDSLCWFLHSQIKYCFNSLPVSCFLYLGAVTCSKYYSHSLQITVSEKVLLVKEKGHFYTKNTMGAFHKKSSECRVRILLRLLLGIYVSVFHYGVLGEISPLGGTLQKKTGKVIYFLHLVVSK